KDFRGCGTAIVTPFDGGEVDYEAFARLVDIQVESGVNFLVPLGSTGETPCLEDDEKVRVLQTCREHACGKTLVAGVGTNSLRHTVRNIRLLEAHGADAFLVVVPYYNKPDRRGQYEYFKAVASETDKPIVLYNVPGRTGVNMEAETALRLAEIGNIVAIKEASSKREQILEIVRNAPEGFSVFSGNDDETLDLMRNGAAGIISVASNLAPSMMAALTKAALRGDWDEADRLNDALKPLYRNCFIESNPMPVKAGLNAMGLIKNELRLPLVPSSDSAYGIMKDCLKGLGII
ncbi:MAG: 4-hydroxy-tetrahydrodipicolinate synthase, partial [Candidatus Cryptobacteroides sp.]